MPKTPSYRTRKGYSQALVTLTDSRTKQRRDYWLGQHNSPESRQLYHRLIAEWESNDRRFPSNHLNVTGTASGSGPKVIEVIRDYWAHASKIYGENELRSFQVLFHLLRQYHGHTPAADFGPRKLRTLRELMIRGDAASEPPRKSWSRRYINSQVIRLRRMFKWAVAQEMVPAAVHQSLCTLEPLKRGRTEARENSKIGPAPQKLLEVTLPHLSRPVRALVELQMLTGARPSELLTLRPCDLEIDDSVGVWTYRPENHKNAHRDQERIIYFGPAAQNIIRTFLTDRPTNAYLFSPADAEAIRRAELHARRKTPLSCGNRPGTNRKESPGRKVGDCYSSDSYCRAIKYACERAFPLPEHLAKRDDETRTQWKTRLTIQQKTEIREWRKVHHWHPYQLRHNAATELRRAFGLEAAQLTLGHASAQITDAVYAERDRTKVIEIMRKIG